jgi:hypothetical protein
VPTVCDERVHVAITVYVRERQPGAQVQLCPKDVPIRPPEGSLLRREDAWESQHK